MADRIIKPDSGNSLVLQDEGGSAALTIDTNGNIDGKGIINGAELFRLASNTSSGTSTVLSDWAKDADFGTKSFTVNTSTGAFTAPSTGYYLICPTISGTGTSVTPRYIECGVLINSVEKFRVSAAISQSDSSGVSFNTTGSFLYAWTNATHTLVIRLSSASNISVSGHASIGLSTISFLRIGDI